MMDGERERGGEGERGGRLQIFRKRIRFVECQLEEGSLSHDFASGAGITVN